MNEERELADKFIRYTGYNLFLTGKAGTGKTTFLKQLRADSPKRMIVVAPTGVAAINAGGVTIHSFFQLPFSPFLPDQQNEAENKKMVSQITKEKRNIIASLDLLVIDEISMVRADLLDAIDSVLRRFKDRNRPFGGVQLLMIGDLQQLAPVVRDEEWSMLKNYYRSPYFFDSKALNQSQYVTIELKKIYRQSDPTFVNILNRIRENNIDAETLEILNKRFTPDFNPSDREGYITLTTHNSQASSINLKKLDMLSEKAFTYKAEIAGNFPTYSYPTDEPLVLKKGAQVMFVKNDPSPEKRYYNGKIGYITAIGHGSIVVKCEDQIITVEPQEWTNAKYTIDPKTNEIQETIEGTYSQFPLRTAWAITIHKSQGLTFDKAIINAGAAFTHGQVYVALSRCRSLEGLVLSAPIRSHVIMSDHIVENFNKHAEENKPDSEVLERARHHYFISLIGELFDYRTIGNRLTYLTRIMEENLTRMYPELINRYKLACVETENSLVQVGNKFKIQLMELSSQSDTYDDDPVIVERVKKGVAYFKQKTAEIIISLLEEGAPEVDNKELRKHIEKEFITLRDSLKVKMAGMEASSEGFNVKAYLSAKSVASMESDKPKKPGAATGGKSSQEKIKKVEVSSDIAHPDLYNRLRVWRKNEADEKNLPVYTILQQKALIGITNRLPSNKKELLSIPGIGKVIVEHYGEKLLEIVNDFRIDQGMTLV